MIKELLKPLEWQGKKPAEGESYRALAVSPVTRYVITDDGRKVKVIYHNFTEDEPAKTKPGFSSVAEAKDWVQGEHYPRKMARWLNTDWSKKAVTPYVREVFADWARTDPLTDTVNWFKVAKPEPTDIDKTTQIGTHYEEVSEMSVALKCDHDETDRLSRCYKTASERMSMGYLSAVDDVELLDSLADQIVTAVGVAYMMGFDIIGALTEVNASNWSKFVDGKAVTDENGKIIKGSDYFKPELEKYLGGSND